MDQLASDGSRFRALPGRVVSSNVTLGAEHVTESGETRPIVAIHQPNFFPWLGYFHKMRWSDVFVILDDAQIQKTGGSVTNRTTLVSQGKQITFTAPIVRTKSGGTRIDEVQFAPGDFRERLSRFLEQAYRRAAFVEEVGAKILAMVANPTDSIAAYNIAAIRGLSAMLGLETKIVLASTLGVTTTSTARLVDILETVDGRTYLCGAGAKNYQEDELFFARGLNVYAQTFSPPLYPRGREEPIAGLSILDALLHVGIEETRKLLDQPLDPSCLRLAKDWTGQELAPGRSA